MEALQINLPFLHTHPFILAAICGIISPQDSKTNPECLERRHPNLNGIAQTAEL